VEGRSLHNSSHEVPRLGVDLSEGTADSTDVAYRSVPATRSAAAAADTSPADPVGSTASAGYAQTPTTESAATTGMTTAAHRRRPSRRGLGLSRGALMLMVSSPGPKCDT